jgi:hypothetical protein
MQNKRILKLLMLSLILLFQFGARATIILDLGIIHKRALSADEGHILVSEVHEVKRLENGEKFLILMKNGVGVEFKVFFVQNLNDFGPSPLIALTGNIYNSQGDIIKSINQNDFTIKLNTEKELVFDDKSGQEVLIKIAPSLL